jgi:hypothetical protein
MSDAIIWKMPGTKDEAIRSQTGEVRLRSEVVVEEGLIYACLIGNLLHAGAVDAAPDEDFIGGIQNAGLGVGGGLSRRFNHLVKVINLDVLLIVLVSSICAIFCRPPTGEP